eukprot:scaffold24274_cov146-Isochrysis_galbana.AAC.1
MATKCRPMHFFWEPNLDSCTSSEKQEFHDGMGTLERFSVRKRTASDRPYGSAPLLRGEALASSPGKTFQSLFGTPCFISVPLPPSRQHVVVRRLGCRDPPLVYPQFW